MSEQLPQPGWYHNAQGQIQWWDGTAWGMLAEDYVPEPAPPAPVVAAVSEPAHEPQAAHEPQTEYEPQAESVAGPAQPVAQDFSREFLEQRYGSGEQPAGAATTSDYSASDFSAAPDHSAPAAPDYPAPDYSAPAAPNYPAPNHYGYAQASSAPSTTKPPVHAFTWVSFASAAVALLSAIVAGSYFIGVLFGLAWLAILASLVFGILAIIQSQKKPLPIVATAIAATGFIWVPIVQVLSVLVTASAGFGAM